MIYCTYEQILQIYPSLTSADFNPFTGTIRLQDNSDGLGSFIISWTNSNPEPTQLQINKL